MNTLDRLKYNAFIRTFTFFKLPLLNWIRPQILELDSKRTVLKIPLGRRTKNHLNVMYFGALAMGAEAAVAIRAVEEIRNCGKPVDFLFKDFTADFKKRAEGHVHFISEDGDGVRALIKKAAETGERQSQTFRSYAIVPSKDSKEVVGEFTVTLSVKLRRKS